MAALPRRFVSPDAGFTLVVIGLLVASAILVWPFLSALLWASVGAIVFRPLYERMLVVSKGKEGRAALLSLGVIVLAVVVPLLVIGTVVVNQAAALYTELEAQTIDVESFFIAMHDGLPTRVQVMVDSAGYGEFAQVREKIAEAVRESLGLLASQAISIGGGALSFVLSLAISLYVIFFLLRDGEVIGRRFCRLLPTDPLVSQELCNRAISIVRATVKGSFLVGLAQGALGTITFWIAGVPSAVLLGVIMAIASLLPAVGTALVWVPVAAFLLLTGEIWQGIVVIASGAFVIGMADNVLRPVLVGRDTGIPDWVILISTLGGISVMGLAGIVVGPVVVGLLMAAFEILLKVRRREGAVPQS